MTSAQMTCAFHEAASLKQVSGRGLMDEELGATDREKLAQLMSQ